MEWSHTHAFTGCGAVGPKDAQQLLDPTASLVVELNLEPSDYLSIDHINLPITLRVGY